MLDYTKIPEIANRIDRIKEIENEGEKYPHMFEKGKKLQLTVTVNDPYLANIMLASMYGGPIPFPGFDLEEIRIRDLNHKDAVINWLEIKIDELKNQ